MMYGKDSGKKDTRQQSYEMRMERDKKMREAQNRSAMKSQKRSTARGKRG